MSVTDRIDRIFNDGSSVRPGGYVVVHYGHLGYGERYEYPEWKEGTSLDMVLEAFLELYRIGKLLSTKYDVMLYPTTDNNMMMYITGAKLEEFDEFITDYLNNETWGVDITDFNDELRVYRKA